MQYKTEELREKAIVALKTNEMITTFEELSLRMPVSRQTMYVHNLDKDDTIKDLLESKKIKVKEHLRGKWFKSDNATLQMGLYKLLGTEEEYHRLSGTRTENNQTGTMDNHLKISFE